MYVVYGTMELHLPYVSSLKEKRKIIQAIMARIRKRFNVSMSEVDHHDLWQRSSIGFAAVTSSFGESELIISVLKETLFHFSDQADLLDFLYHHITD